MKYNEKLSSQLLIMGFYLLITIGSTGCMKTAELDKRCIQSPKYLEEFELPKGLIGYNNYDLALDCAKKTNKPLAIYFTGFTCINCKKFESDFLLQDEVKEMINRNFVLAMLYVDDERELPETEHIKVTSKYSNQSRIARTIGERNMALANKYNHSSHPSLFIAKNSEEVISLIQYNPDGQELRKQLEATVVKIKE